MPTRFAAVLGFVLASSVVAQESKGQLDASPALFSALAAIQAAGYDAEIDSPSNHPLRRALRDHLAKLEVESLPELKAFFAPLRKKDPNAVFSQIVSWSLSVDGPPNFKPLRTDLPMPPDAAALEGFAALLAKFHQQAGLDQLWRKVQPAYEEAIARYHPLVTRAVLEVNAYLRNPTSGHAGKRFQIYVDLIGPPNQVQTRSYGDDYYVVVTAAAEPRLDDIRHGYLHYLIDPMIAKFSERLEMKRGLIDYAQGSPILEDQYKQDFVLLATECLIKAVEARMARRPAMVQQALKEGFVVTPAFDELLAAYEKQEVALQLYIPDIIAGIDLRKEEKRLDRIDFAAERAKRSVRVAPVEREKAPTGAEKTLADAEDLYRARTDLGRARDLFLRVLQETARKPLHAKAYYGMARIATLQNDPELAGRLFTKALEVEPDAEVKSWSLFYLGRLADIRGEAEQAKERYQAALAVEGASEKLRQDAGKGLEGAFRKKE